MLVEHPAKSITPSENCDYSFAARSQSSWTRPLLQPATGVTIFPGEAITS